MSIQAETPSAGTQRSPAAAGTRTPPTALLPAESNWSPEEVTARTGVRFRADVDRDFVRAILPPGWSVQKTNHSRYTEVVDELYTRRAEILNRTTFDRRTRIDWRDEQERR